MVKSIVLFLFAGLLGGTYLVYRQSQSHLDRTKGTSSEPQQTVKEMIQDKKLSEGMSKVLSTKTKKAEKKNKKLKPSDPIPHYDDFPEGERPDDLHARYLREIALLTKQLEIDERELHEFGSETSFAQVKLFKRSMEEKQQRLNELKNNPSEDLQYD